MFSSNFKNICCIFAENKIFEKSKMRQPRWRTCRKTIVAIATVLN